MTARQRNTGIIVAVLTAIAFAGSGPFVKPLLLEGWSAGAAVIVRMLAAAVVILPIAIWHTRADLGVWLRRWKWIVGYGMIAMAATQLFYYTAIGRMPVSMALLLQYLAPVLLLMAAWVQTRRKPANVTLVGAVLSVLGLLLALDLGSATGGLDPIGVLFGALSAVSVCGYYLIAAAMPDDLPPTALIGGGLVVGAATLGALGVVGAVPLAATWGTVELFGTTVPWWVTMGIVVLIGTLGGYLGGVFAARTLGSRLASFLGLLEVLATLAVSAVLLGEIPTWMQGIGAALVIGGVIAVRLAPDTVTVDAPLGPVTAPITLPIDPEMARELREAEGEDLLTSAIPVIREAEALTGSMPIVGEGPRE
ncbi:MAG: EamA family transporter [Microbacteriaceae bacterium]|nr:EamA family transporter [Microbacteriaceae bacterium]